MGRYGTVAVLATQLFQSRRYDPSASVAGGCSRGLSGPGCVSGEKLPQERERRADPIFEILRDRGVPYLLAAAKHFNLSRRDNPVPRIFPDSSKVDEVVEVGVVRSFSGRSPPRVLVHSGPRLDL